MAKDPVCGMNVEEGKAMKIAYKGRNYHVCSLACKKKFENSPEQYIGKK